MQEYIITNDKVYVMSSHKGFELVSNIKDATRFTKGKAENVLNQCFPRKWKKFHLKMKIAPEREIIKYENIDSLSSDVKEFLKNAQYLAVELKQKLDELSAELSNVSKAKVDLEHKIEFAEKANASEGWTYFAALRDVLSKRRKIKDDIQYVSYILGATIKDCGDGKPINMIKGMENRQYTARVLTELFE